MKALRIKLACAGLIFALGWLGPAIAREPENRCPLDETMAQEIVARMNAIRSQPRPCGDHAYSAAGQLVWNAVLFRAASLHAMDMSRRHFFSHWSPEGRSPGERIDRAGYVWQSYGENIGVGQESLDQVLAAWLESPAHCTAMMQPQFREVGLACAKRRDSARLWVLELAVSR